MNEMNEMREAMWKNGYVSAIKDIDRMGIEKADEKLAMRLMCSGCDGSWTMGYMMGIMMHKVAEGWRKE